MKIIAVDDDGTQITLPQINDVAAYLKANRTRLQLSLRDVADAVGVKRQAVWVWEQGRAVPTVEHMVKLVKLFTQEVLPVMQPVATIPAPKAPTKTDLHRNLKLAEKILGA